MHLTFTLPDGTSYTADPFDGTAIIGRSADDAAIALPCDSLSARHAIIEPTADGTGWQIRDLGSANGLTDGTSQAPAFLLVEGATLFLGDVRLDVSLAAPPAARPAAHLAAHPAGPRLVTAPSPVRRPGRRPVSAAASAQVQRLRAAQQRREQSGTAVLFLVLGVLAFGIGFAVRFLQ